jgi:peptidylprolyl isomerase
MPPSRQARARQQRQKDRLAGQAARRAQSRKRRQRIGVTAGALLIVITLVLALTLGATMSNDKPKVTVAPTTVAPTTVPTSAAAVVKNCVGLKDKLPSGAPAADIPQGTPPAKLVTKDLKVGTGPVVNAQAKVQVNYVGIACSTGKIFDTSYGKQPFDADLSGGLIQGWLDGIPGMHVGGVRLLELPPDLAYGAAGSPPVIGPNEPLFFIVEAIKLD